MLPRTSSERAHVALLSALVIAALVPFVDKAFCVDDPMYLWAAGQITRHPLDFYGFEVNWQGTLTPMSVEMQNPPLTSYYQAIVGTLAGWSELAFHLSFIPFAVASVVGISALARRLSGGAGDGLLAGLVAIASPALMVSATNVMADVILLALWTWGVLLWMRGLEEDRPMLLLIAGALTALATMTKYPAISLIPLLLAHALLRRVGGRKWFWPVVALTIPVAVLVAYQYGTARMYGHGLVGSAAKFATLHASLKPGPSLIVTLAFAGGALLGPALAIACATRKRGWIVPAIAAVMATGVGLSMRLDGAILVQLALMCAGGAVILAAACAQAWRGRDAESLMLLLWIAGVFTFAALVNWTINARTLLPMLPAAAIVAIRELRRDPMLLSQRKPLLAGAMILAGAITLALMSTDYRLAGAARSAAAIVRQRHDPHAGQVWFTGHWGFQWYMQHWARPVDNAATVMEPGNLLVMYLRTSDPRMLPPPAISVIEQLDFPVRVPVGRSGFYSDSFGVLPFELGRNDAERFAIVRVHARLRLGVSPDR